MLGNHFGGVHVEVRTSVSETLVTFSSYKRGLAPVQLVNHSKQMICYGEKGNDGKSKGVIIFVVFILTARSIYFAVLNMLLFSFYLLSFGVYINKRVK